MEEPPVKKVKVIDDEKGVLVETIAVLLLFAH